MHGSWQGTTSRSRRETSCELLERTLRTPAEHSLSRASCKKGLSRSPCAACAGFPCGTWRQGTAPGSREVRCEAHSLPFDGCAGGLFGGVRRRREQYCAAASCWRFYQREPEGAVRVFYGWHIRKLQRDRR